LSTVGISAFRIFRLFSFQKLSDLQPASINETNQISVDITAAKTIGDPNNNHHPSHSLRDYERRIKRKIKTKPK